MRDLSEDALLWCPPDRPIAPLPEGLRVTLEFQGLISDNDDRELVERRATLVGHYITDPNFPERLEYFGLAAPSDAKQIERPVIESIRVLQRVGPDGTVNLDVVAEVVQRRKTDRKRWMYGGSTIILDAMGHIRYVILKNVLSKTRERRTNRHLDDHRAFAAHFSDNVPARVNRFRALHRRRTTREA